MIRLLVIYYFIFFLIFYIYWWGGRKSVIGKKWSLMRINSIGCVRYCWVQFFTSLGREREGGGVDPMVPQKATVVGLWWKRWLIGAWIMIVLTADFFVEFWKEVYYCDAMCLYVHMYVCASCLFNNWNLQAVELVSRFWSCDQLGAGTICFFF